MLVKTWSSWNSNEEVKWKANLEKGLEISYESIHKSTL